MSIPMFPGQLSFSGERKIEGPRVIKTVDAKLSAPTKLSQLRMFIDKVVKAI